MARLERPTNESRNPAKLFLEWKSDDKCFSYYDKEAQKNIKVEPPLKVLFMEHYHTVKGWHDSSKSAIYANEVYSISDTPLTVRAFKGGELVKGIYKEIKPKVKEVGGHYTRSIYVMLEDGRLANIQLKGASIGGIKADKSLDKKEHPGYSDFYKENSNKLDNTWIAINEAAEAKSGRITYSIPEFTLGNEITAKEDKMANEAAATLQEYMNNYLNDEPTAFDKERPASEVDKYENAKTEKELADDLEF